MTCRACMSGYITHAEAASANPGRGETMVFYLRKAMLHADPAERRRLEIALKNYRRMNILPDWKMIKG